MTTDITGRDGLIIAKALAMAIITIDRLPPEWRANSDKADMEKLLHHLTPDGGKFQLLLARATIERRGLMSDPTSPGPVKVRLADREIDDNVTKL
jgi:hypothetical protein